MRTRTEPSGAMGKVWVEAEMVGGGRNAILSLVDIRKRRKAVQAFGDHNATVPVTELARMGFPPQFLRDLEDGRPVRFKMFQHAFEGMIGGGGRFNGLDGLDGDLIHGKFGHRPLHVIAGEIALAWKKPYFGAVPYLQALLKLDDIDDEFGAENARTMVAYFLANAQTWRGPKAREIKAELKKLYRSGGHGGYSGLDGLGANPAMPDEVRQVTEAMVANAIEGEFDADRVYSGFDEATKYGPAHWSIGDNYEQHSLWMVYTDGVWSYHDRFRDPEEWPMPGGFKEAMGNAQIFFTG